MIATGGWSGFRPGCWGLCWVCRVEGHGLLAVELHEGQESRHDRQGVRRVGRQLLEAGLPVLPQQRDHILIQSRSRERWK